MKQGNIKRAFTYLESGAVILVATRDGKKDNVMTISWQMVLDFTPRIAITTGSWNESFDTILKTKECTINIPTFDIVDKVVEIGTVHGSKCDKFKEFNLKKMKGKKVKVPIIDDCLASIECKLEDYKEDYGILIFKGINLWENKIKRDKRVIHANGDGTFYADGEFINLRTKMRDKVPKGCERL